MTIALSEMNAIISLCHFCELHGPAIIFCTQAFHSTEPEEHLEDVGIEESEALSPGPQAAAECQKPPLPSNYNCPNERRRRATNTSAGSSSAPTSPTTTEKPKIADFCEVCGLYFR